MNIRKRLTDISAELLTPAPTILLVPSAIILVLGMSGGFLPWGWAVLTYSVLLSAFLISTWVTNLRKNIECVVTAKNELELQNRQLQMTIESMVMALSGVKQVHPRTAVLIEDGRVTILTKESEDFEAFLAELDEGSSEPFNFMGLGDAVST